MAERAACTMGDLFAAVATVAGVYRRGGCLTARPVPVLAIHGLRDRRAPYDPAAAWTAAWATHNACGAVSLSAGAETTVRTWTRCADGADVLLQTVATLGHAWPNDPTDPAESASPVDANAEIWRFFVEHPMRDQ
jgi:polyhydroxybutyrate depolymerase